MPEFTLSIETPQGTTTDEDVMGRFDEAMRASEEVSGSTAILDHDAGTISSTFQVSAPTLEVARMIATRVFADALRNAGLSGDSLWRIVEADEEPEWPRSDL
ncbi:MAG: hypothetical protein ACRDNG_02455 [Gaiellaceae bacterium]